MLFESSRAYLETKDLVSFGIAAMNLMLKEFGIRGRYFVNNLALNSFKRHHQCLLSIEQFRSSKYWCCGCSRTWLFKDYLRRQKGRCQCGTIVRAPQPKRQKQNVFVAKQVDHILQTIENSQLRPQLYQV